MNQFKTFVKSSLPNLSEDTLQGIAISFTKQLKKKGDFLLSQGEVCKNLYFLSEGVSRSFTIKDGNDITTWFSFKNEFVTSFTSFFPEEPSYESIEMLTDGVVYKISKLQLINIKNQSNKIEGIINHFSQLYTIQLEKRLLILQTYTAKEKYDYIIQHEPHLVQLVPSKYLASYLGVTRETLSRIRAAIN